MSFDDPLKYFGLKRGEASRTDVRKAYAKKLKQIRPDDDPEGFMVLRENYEQALNIVEWNLSAPDDEDEGDDETPENDPKEIRYWYDEKLDFHFNSSPSGKLIEKSTRWILEKGAKNPQAFFKELASLPEYAEKSDIETLSNSLLVRVVYDCGCDVDEYTGYETLPDCARPHWLSDDVIVELSQQFDWLNRSPEYEWDAVQLNCIKDIFKPVLVDHSLLTNRSRRYNVEAHHIKDIETFNKDDHGSYYDKKQKQWINMSPVGVAMRDIKSLTVSLPGDDTTAPWREILDREELQPIDEFQELDEYLRQYICSVSGYGEREKPKKPAWMGADLLILLDDTFGWNSHAGNNHWDYEEYRWLQKLIMSVRGKAPRHQPFPNRHSSRQTYMGSEKMPWFLHFGFILGSYTLFRIVQTYLWL